LIPDLLEAQRAFCLHNFTFAVAQVLSAERGSEAREKASHWLFTTIMSLFEIEKEIRKYQGAMDAQREF